MELLLFKYECGDIMNMDKVAIIRQPNPNRPNHQVVLEGGHTQLTMCTADDFERLTKMCVNLPVVVEKPKPEPEPEPEPVGTVVKGKGSPTKPLREEVMSVGETGDF